MFNGTPPVNPEWLQHQDELLKMQQSHLNQQYQQPLSQSYSVPPPNFSQSSYAPPPPYQSNGHIYTPTGQYPVQTINSASPSSNSQLKCVAIGLVLAAIAAFAAYYCLMNGLPMIDYPMSNLQLYGGYALTYMGVAFSAVAAGNIIYSVGKWGCHDDRKKFEYSSQEMKLQIVGSLLAPVALVPIVLYVALSHLQPGRVQGRIIR